MAGTHPTAGQRGAGKARDNERERAGADPVGSARRPDRYDTDAGDKPGAAEPAMTTAPDAAFPLIDNQLHCEGVALESVAQRYGTPTYVYSRQAVLDPFRRYADALAGRRGLVCYAVKANSNLGILHLLARAGAGFDIVSGGELARVLAAGAPASRVVFSGVGKRADEIADALAAGIACFNVESEAELHLVDAIAQRLGRRAPVSLRVNPDVDPQTHPYISTGLKSNKFGIPIGDAPALYQRAAGMAGLEVVGVDCHIGSQLTSIAPMLDAANRVFDLVDRIEHDGIPIPHLDFGGGLGIAYRDEDPPEIEAWVAAILSCADRRGHGDKFFLLEPGRSIVGNAGALLTRVLHCKPGAEKNFAIVDAAMNDLIRPTLYDAWMDVRAVRPRPGMPKVFDVVGPVCESGDWLARERALCIEEGDLLAVLSAGAYGMSMASNYNSRGRPAEVLIDGTQMHLVRRRETIDDLIALEFVVPE